MSKAVELIEELRAKVAAQKKFQNDNALPHYAPDSGICYRCGRQIYDRITLDRASTELITGCPYCNSSYCA